MGAAGDIHISSHKIAPAQMRRARYYRSNMDQTKAGVVRCRFLRFSRLLFFGAYERRNTEKWDVVVAVVVVKSHTRSQSRNKLWAQRTSKIRGLGYFSVRQRLWTGVRIE